ncbi:tumor necrosis factor receptor superfamily member 6 isoform X2 [Sceloporus undulatus]|uniref:tumor necrosis factor receptor superfamily member 6 isoform X2 n=1 Tax=Sceloporus undulatus TaxID=8520 RepID=UPI001C4D6378|nr:tumor necrosis factor receptor superfamily member 6 isoform X2 [Sceloporus undulatus]
MIKRLLLCLSTLCPACIVIAGLSRDSDSHGAYRKHFAVKYISKRDGTICQTNTQYLYNTTTDAFCCYSCDPGYVAEYVGCKKADPRTKCKRCTEGIEYMDKFNHKTKCLRCNDCDSQHGLEVETNCTITQNIKCKCMPGFFCDSQPCQHCNPCDKCENGIILEKCTETKDAICQRKVSVRNNYEHNISTLDDACTETEPPSNPDIDLTPHISDIAEEMKLEDVIKLVRKLGLSPARIDEVTVNNYNNVSEQKIKLLERWYQENGRNGAYGTLITTLIELRFRATAESIKQKIRHG